MKILGIETSCDETAAAVVENGRTVLSNAIYSQIAKHRPYGGVVPEIASRNHVAKLPGIIAESLETAGETYDSIDALAIELPDHGAADKSCCTCNEYHAPSPAEKSSLSTI